jgi:hypothetical protein
MELTMKYLLRPALLFVLTSVITATSVCGWAQSATDKAPAESKSSTENAEPAKTDKKPKPGPFHGKLVAMDKVAKTITVGKRTFNITSETKIKKAGKPATLDDGVVGEEVSGYVKPREDGKLAATTVNFGPKSQSGSAEKKSKETDKEGK